MVDSNIQRGVLCGIAAAFIWSLWPVASRYAVQQELNAFDIVALRYITAGIIFIPVCLRYNLKQVNWWHVILLSITVGAPHVMLASVGVFYAPAGHAGVLIPGAMLVIATLGAWLCFKERPDKNRWLGLGAIAIGLLLTGLQFFDKVNTTILLGDLCFVIAGITWGGYTLLFRHSKMDGTLVTALVSIVSLVIYVPLYFISGISELAAASWNEIVFQMFFQGLVSAVLALLFYTKAVEYLGAVRGALFTAIQPGLTILLAFPLLDEVPTTNEIIGMVILSVGMIWALELKQQLKSKIVAA